MASETTKCTAATEAALVTIPSSIICLGVAPFLPLKDILRLSETCRWLHRNVLPSSSTSPSTAGTGDSRSTHCHDNTTTSAAAAATGDHNRDESTDMMWTKLLQRDFGLQYGSHNGAPSPPLPVDHVWTIPSQQVSGVSLLAPNDMLRAVRSPFIAYKAWKRTSLAFFKHRDQQGNQHVRSEYFIRAAVFWQRVAQWCDQNGEYGNTMLGSFDPGMKYCDHDARYREKPGAQAMLAVYAFCAGQNQALLVMARDFFGLLGGYSAYDFVSSTYLRRPQAILEYFPAPRREPPDTFERVVVAASVTVMPLRRLMLCPENGLLEYRVDENSNYLAAAMQGDMGEDSFLVWLEEYVRRLATGVYKVGRLDGSSINPMRGIMLYPCYRPGSTCKNVSRFVTRGVEVIASGVYVPQAQIFGFEYIYSLRMRLLGEGEEGYLSPEERGFHRCELRSRHWEIFDRANNTTQTVDGDGVVGMYPRLEDGGFREPARGTGEFNVGSFMYQSCLGPMEGGTYEESTLSKYMLNPWPHESKLFPFFPVPGATFSGHLVMRACSITTVDSPSTQQFAPFQVKVGLFDLDNRPEYLY